MLEEMEATLWEYEAFNGAKPNYTLEGFRASTKIFMSALLDKFFEKQQAEGVSQEDTLKAVEKLGQDVRAFKSEDGTAVFCFELDEEERKKIAETGELWVALRTFNQPLQPICVTVNKSDVLITQ